MESSQEKLNNYVKSIEEKHRIEKILINILKFLSILVIGLIFGHYFNKCSKTEQKPIIKTNYVRYSIKTTDTLINTIVKERIKIKTKLNTLNNIIYVPRSIIIKDSVLCDSLYSLAIVQKKMISNDSILITKLNVNIKKYKQIDTIQSKTIDSLQRLPKGRLKWFLYGIGTGIVIKSIIK